MAAPPSRASLYRSGTILELAMSIAFAVVIVVVLFVLAHRSASPRSGSGRSSCGLDGFTR